MKIFARKFPHFGSQLNVLSGGSFEQEDTLFAKAMFVALP